MKKGLIEFLTKEKGHIVSGRDLLLITDAEEYYNSINSEHTGETRTLEENKDKEKHLKTNKGCNSMMCLHPDNGTCDGCDAYF